MDDFPRHFFHYCLAVLGALGIATGLFFLIVPFAFADSIIETATSHLQERAAWGISGQEYGAQTFTADADGEVSSIENATIISSGSPVDQVYIELQSTSGGVPTGTVLGTSNNQTIVETACAAEMTLTTYTFASPVTIENGTVYAIVMNRSGSLSGSNYYADCGTDTSTYAGGNSLYYSAGWNSQTSDRYDIFTIESAPPPPTPPPIYLPTFVSTMKNEIILLIAALWFFAFMAIFIRFGAGLRSWYRRHL